MLKIDGIKELTETLKTVSPAEGTRIARRVVVRIARDARDKARQRAPVGATGNLRRSIKSRRRRGKPGWAESEVYADRSGGKTGLGYHWHLVEFGTGPRTTKGGKSTGSMPAQPFITPTVEEERPRTPAVYRNLWWPEFRKEMIKRAKRQAARQKR